MKGFLGPAGEFEFYPEVTVILSRVVPKYVLHWKLDGLTEIQKRATEKVERKRDEEREGGKALALQGGGASGPPGGVSHGSQLGKAERLESGENV